MNKKSDQESISSYDRALVELAKLHSLLLVVWSSEAEPGVLRFLHFELRDCDTIVFDFVLDGAVGPVYCHLPVSLAVLVLSYYYTKHEWI